MEKNLFLEKGFVKWTRLIDHLVNPFDKEIEISGDWKVN